MLYSTILTKPTDPCYIATVALIPRPQVYDTRQGKPAVDNAVVSLLRFAQKRHLPAVSVDSDENGVTVFRLSYPSHWCMAREAEEEWMVEWMNKHLHPFPPVQDLFYVNIHWSSEL